jgi:predicted ATPase
MYTQLKIENFRGIRSLTLDRLARVNLLVGANSVGKTSVLEALWLLRGAGNPELPLSMAVQRGGKPVFAPAPENHWLTLFPNLDTDVEIELSGVLGENARESLKLRALTGVQLGVRSNGGKGHAGDAAVTGRISTTEPPRYTFHMKFTDGLNAETISTFEVVKESARVTPNPQITKPAVLLSDRASSEAAEIAALFSKCQDHGRVSEIVDGLRIVDPGIEDLSLGYSIQENRPILYMHRSGVEGRLPFDISGGGGRRVLEMLISILSEDAIPVMIDEFESGIYYANLERVWRSVDRASQISGCQLFVSTHSLESIHAAVDAFQFEHPEDLRIFRLEPSNDRIDVVDYDFEVALAATEANLEMR